MTERYRKNPQSIRKRTNLTLDPSVWEKAKEHCYAEGISVSEFINRLLMEHVKEADKKQFESAKKKTTTKKKKA